MGNSGNGDLVQWQDISPPSDVNAQVSDYLTEVDDSQAAPYQGTPEQQSVIQLQNEMRMDPRS